MGLVPAVGSKGSALVGRLWFFSPKSRPMHIVIPALVSLICFDMLDVSFNVVVSPTMSSP